MFSILYLFLTGQKIRYVKNLAIAGLRYMIFQCAVMEKIHHLHYRVCYLFILHLRLHSIR